MWEVITTMSEIDTVQKGTLIAKENPVKNENLSIYKVYMRTEEYITAKPEGTNDTEGSITLNADDLFDQAWWMMKEE